MQSPVRCPKPATIARAFASVGALCAAALLAACSMASSELIQKVSGVSCHTDAGSYYLAKSFFSIKINQFPDPESNKPTYYIETIEQHAEPDRNALYCLDYLASATSSDVFTVQKVSGKSLLKKVSTSADDKSAEIVSTLIKTLFVGLSGNPNFDANASVARSLRSGLGPTLRFEGDYDPFDKAQTSFLNDAINDFGFCLTLEGYTLDETKTSIDNYCDRPLQHSSREMKLSKIGALEYGPAPRPFSDGIFYRPKLPYNYMLFVKENMQAPGTWRLRGTTTVQLENISPVLALNIDRTYFAKRETTIDFDDGALRDIKIEKGSELQGFVEIPLQVAQSVVALPTNIIQIKINNTNNNAKIIEAQEKLIVAQRQKAETESSYVAYKDSVTRTAVRSGAAGSPRSLDGQAILEDNAQCMAICKNPPDDLTFCQRSCQCQVECTASGTGTPEACEQRCTENTSATLVE